ncbi:hypothetical protein V8E51_019100 [Hyaloscypha variabilis]
MADTKHIHKTLPITPEEFQPGGLRLYSHTQEEISNVIIKHVSRRGEDLLPRQIEGLARFKYDGSWNLGQPNNLRDMRKYFEIFNDVLYNGVLTGHYQVEILGDEWALQRLGFVTLGYCELEDPEWQCDPRFELEKAFVRIVICGQESEKDRPATEKIQQYLETLVHEMLHAVFKLFTCQRNDGCSEKALEGSHNLWWQAAAKAVEEASLVMFMGLRLSWERENDMAWDAHTGENLPNDAVLRSLGLDIKQILHMLNFYREERARTSKKEGECGPVSANNCIRGSGTIDIP